MMLLWEQRAPFQLDGEEAPFLEPYFTTKENAPAILIMPGGSYRRRADHEGVPVAKWLNRLGIHAFIVHYRVAPHKHPVPLLDAARAMRLVRHHAKQWNVNPNKIGVLGFSAGGHLASTLATKFDRGDAEALDPIEKESSRPDLLILGYPVITFGTFGHKTSMENLLGESPKEDLRLFLSSEQHVTSESPPAFLWHTSEDETVPVENSLLFASALSRAGILFELHVLESGPHGLGLAVDHPKAVIWTKLCEKWLRMHHFLLR